MQRGARNDVCRRMHSGAALQYEPLPVRRCHSGPDTGQGGQCSTKTPARAPLSRCDIGKLPRTFGRYGQRQSVRPSPDRYPPPHGRRAGTVLCRTLYPYRRGRFVDRHNSVRLRDRLETRLGGPLLIFLGLPANVANGTNRIAILLQNVVGVASFKQQKVLDQKIGFQLGLPAAIGAFIGALLAADLDEQLLEYIIAGVLIMMFFLVIFKPDKWLKGDDSVNEKPGILKMIIFFFIGVYGGFIQAGVGFFLLAGLVLGAGFDLVKANALKVFIVLLYTPIALAVFMYNGQVDYMVGFTLAIGNMLGAYIASRLAVKKGAKFVRYILLFALIAMAAKLFGLFDFLL